MLKYTLSLFFALTCFIAIAQKPIPDRKVVTIDKSTITIKTDHRHAVPKATPTIMDIERADFTWPLQFQKPRQKEGLKFFKDKNNSLPIMITGKLEQNNLSADTETRCFEYLNEVKDVLRLERPEEEFLLKKQSTDQFGIKHVRMGQYYNGIKVYGGEIILHEKDQAVFLFNGRYYPTPELDITNPSVSLLEAENIVKTDHGNWDEIDQDLHAFIAHEQLKSELVIYHKDRKIDQERLAWHITAIPNITERWEYFVDAQTGTIIHKFSNVCTIHGKGCSHNEEKKSPTDLESENDFSSVEMFGPETAQATDLSGVNRTINVYETGGTYYMIDASRPMFNASISDFPNNPSGVIWSIDAFNTSPQNSNFTYDHLTSSNNNWTNPTAVSAHYNGGIAYEYFKNTFGRESINGQGGNIVSFINVAESNGTSMDNAFWNGAAMFYGNGNQAFNAPLAKALDVAGHEMSHGVIQNEANLEYQFESGALNESFADVFGAMIDRNDWKIGEEVANPSVFPTGTMRDMQNPNNGGNSNDFYWQPDHVNEMYTGTQDNGGVHINSGIPNHAYYLFADAIGKDKAEEIYYNVLANYLVLSSQFVDLRFAVEQATAQMYGSGSTEFLAAQDAFNTVGIGEGGGNDYQDDIEVNPGDDFVLWSDLGFNNINNAQTNGTPDGTFSSTDHISKPSITDDGSIILFIDANNNMIEVDVDWSTGQVVGEFTIEGSGIWRNVATSKDGTKLAAITTDNTNEVFVFDFNTQSSQWFELYNPTSADGVSTGDVEFPDVLEWDNTGENVIYDALNIIEGQSSNIEYWDIGFLKVWDNSSDDFGTGLVSKLFSGLPENVSVGNPTFSKNSPYIIAFDFIESTSQGTNFEVLGVNIQTGDQGSIFQSNTLGYPSYSVDDNQIIFSFLNSGTDQIIAIRDLAGDKINGTGDALIFIEDAEWGVWFATGDRNLTSVDPALTEMGIAVFPNPIQNELTIEWDGNKSQLEFSIFDVRGQLVKQGVANDQRSILNLNSLSSGMYLMRVSDGEQTGVVKIIKQ